MASTDKLDKLRKLSLEARNTAYCPYSKFRVGCAILLKNDNFVTGANVENCSYPAGICAERCALVKVVTDQSHQTTKVADNTNIRAIGIASDLKSFCSPCGICRQVIREFCNEDIPIYMFNRDGEYKMMTLGQLLPMTFGPESLKDPEDPEVLEGPDLD